MSDTGPPISWDQPNPIFIAIPVVFGVIAIGFFAFIASVITRKRNRLRGAQLLSKRWEFVKVTGEARLQTALEIEQRRLEELETSNGHQVWFSRYVFGGQLQHIALIVNGTKYLLQRTLESDAFAYSATAVSGWDVQQEERAAALVDISDLKTDGQYLCLVGWTHLSNDELELACDGMVQEFDKTSMTAKHVQQFLQNFAKEAGIKPALDYAWFQQHSDIDDTLFQRGLPQPTKPILQRQVSLLMQFRGEQTAQNTHSQQDPPPYEVAVSRGAKTPGVAVNVDADLSGQNNVQRNLMRKNGMLARMYAAGMYPGGRMHGGMHMHGHGGHMAAGAVGGMELGSDVEMFGDMSDGMDGSMGGNTYCGDYGISAWSSGGIDTGASGWSSGGGMMCGDGGTSSSSMGDGGASSSACGGGGGGC